MRGCVLTALSAGATVGLAFVLGRVAPESRPQVVSGNDALSVAFGGAKSAVSQAMYERADRYFHGGVDAECSCHHDEASSHEHSAQIEQSNSRTIEQFSWDPWAWINARIRAPEVERHLEGERAVELLPWFWAAVKADPKNVEAWSTAWYSAVSIIGDRKLAKRILDEGRAVNPDSLELAFCQGRFVFDKGRGDPAAAERAFAAARELGLRICGGDLSRLSEKDGATYSFVIDYLAKFAAMRGERETLERYLGEVEKSGSKTPVEDAIRARIRNLAK